MKKLLCILLATCMVFALAACGEVAPAPVPDPNDTTTTTATTTPTTTTTPTNTTTTTSTTPEEITTTTTTTQATTTPTQPTTTTTTRATTTTTTRATTTTTTRVTTTTPRPTQTTKVGDIIKFGGYDWRVLDIQSGRALLLSDKVLERRVHHNIREETITAFSWADSKLRAYLNGEFYNRFSTADRAKIVQVTNTNPNNQWFGTAGGANTQDRVFLLSLDEVVKYFGDADQLAKPEGERELRGIFYGVNSASREAYCRDISCCGVNETYGHWWWLRSPGEINIAAAFVDGLGGIWVRGSDAYNTEGVRPAMWINL